MHEEGLQFLSINCSDETADWLSRKFGTYRDNEGRRDYVVSPEEFHNLPVNPQDEGVAGWYYSKRLPEMRTQKHTIPWSEIEKVKLDQVPAMDERNRVKETDYELKGWDKPEHRALFGDGATSPDGLTSFGHWPEGTSDEQIEEYLRKDALRRMNEPKKQVVDFHNEELVFYCTDDEIPDHMREEMLHALWWQKQSREFQEKWVDAAIGMNEAEIRDLKRQMYAARDAERRKKR